MLNKILLSNNKDTNVSIDCSLDSLYQTLAPVPTVISECSNGLGNNKRELLLEFNRVNSSNFNFEETSNETKTDFILVLIDWLIIVHEILYKDVDKKRKTLLLEQSILFECLRICLRDKIMVRVMESETMIIKVRRVILNVLISKNITDKDNESSKITLVNDSIAEACKCLCNLLYQSVRWRESFGEEEYFNKIVLFVEDGADFFMTCDSLNQIKLSSDQEKDIKKLSKYNASCMARKNYTVRALCMITGHLSTIRWLLFKNDAIFHISNIFMKVLNISENHKCKWASAQFSKDSNLTLIIDILKLLFNLSMGYRISELQINDPLKALPQLGSCLAHLLVCYAPNNSEAQQLENKNIISHVSGLFLNLPIEIVNYMIFPMSKEEMNSDIIYKGGYCMEIEEYDVKSLAVLLIELDRLLKATNKNTESLCEHIYGLTALASSNRICRKYFRMQILPPIKDANVRPEQLTTLRGKLVSLLTDLTENLKTAASDFLFVLCKENVDRFVKHVGVGNGAGYLAMKGLLSGEENKKINGKYTDSSDDSDTEQFLAIKDLINPITGMIDMNSLKTNEKLNEEQKQQILEALEKLNTSNTSASIIGS